VFNWRVRKTIRGAYSSLTLLALATFTSSAAETLTYPEIIHRLTDMEHLSVLPPEREKTALASSYDRSSQYDAATDKYLHWDANGDNYGIVRKEGSADVLADIEGPGCIWRMWAAKTQEGHVKIYLDGATTPTIDLPYYGYFDGKNEPFTRTNLVYTTTVGAVNGDPYAGGRNNYTPIPFQKSCKIVAESGWGAYYQYTYTTFPAGTVVPTFNPKLSPADTAALDEANRILGECGKNPAGPYAGEVTEAKSLTLAPGEKATVADLSGAQAITALKVKFDWPTGLPKDVPSERNLVRQLTMQITWDDEKMPAVWSPLGDFFGYIGGASFFKTLPAGLTDSTNSDSAYKRVEDGQFYSYWYMPFDSRAKIEVGNDSAQPITETWEITHAPLDRPIAELGRFHSKWHRDAFLPERADRAPDWTLLRTQGRGRFVGTQLHVWSPKGGWWGEGDDKFFVDGEKFPSSFGTGSEDYFGYAWCLPTVFNRAFHSQVRCESNDQGHVANNRWHISDSVPFQTSFEGCLEKYFSNERPTLYAAVAYWYLAPGGTDGYAAAPVDQRTGYWESLREPGVIEGESMKLGDHLHSAGPEWLGRQWSGEMDLFWWPKDIGETLDMTLPVEKAGKYQFMGCFTKRNFNGMFQAYVDGVKTGSPIDLNAPPKANILPSGPIDLGTVNLTVGDHKLRFELVGRAPDNKQEPGAVLGFGLDYVKLVPAP
jgi:hypothetical protein